MYYGDLNIGDVVDFKFTTVNTAGAPATLSGTPVISVYKDNGTTESTAGVTLTVDFDGRTGFNHVRITLSSDAAFYTPGSDFQVIITTGNVSGTSVVGYVLAHFSIYRRTASRVRAGIAQGGAASSITLDAGASATNGLYDPGLVLIRSGTGAGQARIILDYNGSTKVAIVDRPWRTNPDNTSVFEIYPVGNLISVNEGLAQGGGATSITLNALASSTDNLYKGQLVVIRGGTGADQTRIITAYNGTTKVATVGRAWDVNPDNTSVYIMVQSALPKLDDSLRTTDVNSANLDAAISTRASQTSVNTIDDFVDSEIADIQTRLPAALVSGRMDSSVGAVAANAISDASVSSDMDSYTAKIWVIKESTTADHYAVAWFKNNVRITAGITSPTIQVIKGSDGTDLIAATALTEIGSTHRFKKDETTNKLVGGQIYFAVVSATIDGSTRTWDQQIGRDSS